MNVCMCVFVGTRQAEMLHVQSSQPRPNNQLCGEVLWSAVSCEVCWETAAGQWTSRQ